MDHMSGSLIDVVIPDGIDVITGPDGFIIERAYTDDGFETLSNFILFSGHMVTDDEFWGRM